MSDNEIYRILKLLEEKKITLNEARLLIEIAINNKIMRSRRNTSEYSPIDVFI
jgi:hypothetical protein